jgi:prepilin-type N-terminal cleavage/methylation domain-containing protein
MVNKRFLKGFTFIEMIAVIVLLGFVSIGMYSTFAYLALQSSGIFLHTQGVIVARSIMSEVTAKPIIDPATDVTCVMAVNTAARENYETLCDFHNYQSVGIENISGSALSGLELFDVSVNISNVLPSYAAAGLPVNCSYQILVQVNSPDNQSTILEAYRFNENDPVCL